MPEIQGTNVLFRRWDAAPSPASPKAIFLPIHALSIELVREKVFQDILDWVAPRV